MPWPQRAARGKPTAGGLSPTSQARQRGLAVASALASRFDRGLAPDWGLAALVAVGEAGLPALQAQDDSEQLTDGHTVKMFEVRCSSLLPPNPPCMRGFVMREATMREAALTSDCLTAVPPCPPPLSSWYQRSACTWPRSASSPSAATWISSCWQHLRGLEPLAGRRRGGRWMHMREWWLCFWYCRETGSPSPIDNAHTTSSASPATN